MNRYEVYCNLFNYWINVFQHAKDEHHILSIYPTSEKNKFKSISINHIDLQVGICGGCKNLFHCVYIEGVVHEGESKFEYEGWLKGFEIMCKCYASDVKEWWNSTDGIKALLDLRIDEMDREKMWKRFIDQNTKIVIQ